MDLKLLTESIRKLEISLHQPETRKDVSMLNKLLADEFIEISKSGKLWTKSEIIKDLANETGAEITSTDFSLSILSEKYCSDNLHRTSICKSRIFCNNLKAQLYLEIIRE